MFGNIPRAVRALRVRAGWTQATLGSRAGLSRYVVSRTERSELASMTLGNLDRIAVALGATLHVQLRWRGEQLDRLIDAAHAALQEAFAELLTGLGWVVRAEVSFNHFGDRGRVDIIGLHPTRRLVVVAEIKSGIGDIQETLGRLDIKTRLGAVIAREIGWTNVAAIVPVLVIADTRAARRTVEGHAALFNRFSLRGRRAVAWLRRPGAEVPSGLLWFANRPDLHPVRTQRR
jgi:transcriptional regulator with XRE-family HTH domain